MLEKMNGLNRVYNSDCIKIMSKFPSESIDLIIADTPYNVGKDYGNDSDKQSDKDYIDFTENWITEAIRILKKDGTLYTFGGKEFIAHIYIILEKKEEAREEYKKDNGEKKWWQFFNKN